MFKHYNRLNKKAVLTSYKQFSIALNQTKKTLSSKEQKAINFLLNSPQRMNGVLVEWNNFKQNKKVSYSLKTFNVFGVLNLQEATELNLKYKNTTERKVFLQPTSPVKEITLEWLKQSMTYKKYQKCLKEGFDPDDANLMEKAVVKDVLYKVTGIKK